LRFPALLIRSRQNAARFEGEHTQNQQRPGSQPHISIKDSNRLIRQRGPS